MCNTSNAADDGGGSGGGGLSPTLKKPHKRQKVPKRGPGVAELEKILREQEKSIKSSDHHENPHFHMLRPPNFSSHIDVLYIQTPSFNGTSPTSMSNSNPSTSFFTRHHNVVGPATMPVPNSNYGSAGGGTTNADNALLAGGLLPERAFFPVARTADGGKSDGGFSLPSRAVKKKKHCSQDSTSMMNHYPGSVACSSNVVLSVGLCDPTEPPSSQRLCHNYPPIGPHDKVIGVKRPPPPPSVDNVPPIGLYQVPQVPSHKHRPDWPTSFNHRVGYNSNLTKPMPRDEKWDVPPLEFNYLQNYKTELHGPPDGNIFRFLNAPDTGSAPPPFQTLQLQLPKFDHPIPFQGSTQEPKQRPMSAGPEDQKKPLYSFLPSKEQAKETLPGLNIDRENKDEEDEIDLNLKLSTS